MVAGPDIVTIDLNTFEFSKPIQRAESESGSFDWSLSWLGGFTITREKQRAQG